MMATICPQLEETVFRIQSPGSLSSRRCGSGADSADCMSSDHRVPAHPWSSSTVATLTVQSTAKQHTNSPWPDPWATPSVTPAASRSISDLQPSCTIEDDDDAIQTVPTFEAPIERSDSIENRQVLSIKREKREEPQVTYKVVPPPAQRFRKTRSHADLGRAVRVAAVKNAEIKQSPVRANSLFQTLLQRRLWFSLMNELAIANK